MRRHNDTGKFLYLFLREIKFGVVHFDLYLNTYSIINVFLIQLLTG